MPNAQKVQAALQFFVDYYNNKTPDSVELEHVMDKAEDALGLKPNPRPKTDFRLALEAAFQFVTYFRVNAVNSCNFEDILEVIEQTGCNEFDGKKIAKFLRLGTARGWFGVCDVAFGQEYSPVLYIKVLDCHLDKVRKSIKALKPDEFNEYPPHSDNLNSETTIRLWWD